MKKLFILLLLLMTPLVYARNVDMTLYEDDSYMKDGVNITLLDINKEKDKFIICVNGKKHIVTEEGITEKYFVIRVDDINKDNVELEIDIDRDCDDCECTGYCNNKRCYSNPKYVPPIKESEQDTKDIIEDEVGVGNYALIVFIILFVLILFIAYYVVKKKI